MDQIPQGLSDNIAQHNNAGRVIEELQEFQKSLVGGIRERAADAIRQAGTDCSGADASHLYWCSELVAKTVKDAYYGVTGKRLNPDPLSIPKVCTHCESEGIREVTSWSASRKVESSSYFTCEDCETELVQRRKQEKADEAKRAAEDLRTMPYDDYLQTQHWRLLSKETRRAAGFRCQLCNAQRVQLNVHHRTYENRGSEKPEDLIVLCSECHAKFHNKPPSEVS